MHLCYYHQLRCQRVSTCFALLFLSMLGNAMWYGGKSKPSQSGFQLGFISLSSEECIIGLMMNLLTFPIVFLIIFLFKYSKPRALRENRVTKALMENEEDNEDDSYLNDASTSQTESRQASAQSRRSNFSAVLDSSHSETRVKFFLPFFCAYIGWFLCLFCIGVSIFFLWAYGITFGNNTLYKWLTSFVISFFTSFLIFEPLKVC